MLNRRPALALALGVVLLFSACGGGADAGDRAEAKGAEADGTTEENGTGGTSVEIVNFLFEPAELQVPPGTKVTWTNKDDAPHNVHDVSDLKTPMSPDMNKGESFSITYEKPGEYKYDCGLHTYMTGTIKVT